jgi:hypothetical protein
VFSDPPTGTLILLARLEQTAATASSGRPIFLLSFSLSRGWGSAEVLALSDPTLFAITASPETSPDPAWLSIPEQEPPDSVRGSGDLVELAQERLGGRDLLRYHGHTIRATGARRAL